MADAPFNLTGAVTFDLSSGSVTLSHVSRCVLAPANGLSSLCEAAGEAATRAFAVDIGSAIGVRLAKHLERNSSKEHLSEVSTATFVEVLRGEFALAGLGSVRIETWGKALLFVVKGASMPASFVASVLEGALAEATGRKAFCTKLSESESETRFLVVGREAAQLVAKQLADGVAWEDVLIRIQSARVDVASASTAQPSASEQPARQSEQNASGVTNEGSPDKSASQLSVVQTESSTDQVASKPSEPSIDRSAGESAHRESIGGNA